MAPIGPRPIRKCHSRLVRLAPLLALALALSGCLFESTPATPTPPTPTPTPVPTPTPTAQQRIAFATPTPTPTLPARPSPTPTAPPIRELQDAGQLLYIGSVGSKSGVVTINADGSGQRLLVEGAFDFVEWAPDGQRFVTRGAPGEGTGNGPTDVALFDAAGRLLKRFSLAGGAWHSAWAPDSRHVAVTVFVQDQPGTTGSFIGVTWIVSEAGAVEIEAGQQSGPAPWSSRGRLAVTAPGDTDGDGAMTERDQFAIWTVDATGGDARLVANERAFPIGWSADGATLFAVGEFQQARIGGAGYAGPTALLAFDLDTGARRTVVTAADLPAPPSPPATPRQRTGTPAGEQPERRQFGWAVVAPMGNRIALWTVTPIDRGSGGLSFEDWHLLVIDDGGRIKWQASDATAGFVLGVTWSPDGSRLAHTSSQQFVHVAHLDGDDDFAIAASASDEEVRMAWSPDGRWLALTRPRRLDIVAAAWPNQAWQIANEARSPAWRPKPAP